MMYEIVVIVWWEGATIHQFQDMASFLHNLKEFTDMAHPNVIVQSAIYPIKNNK